MAGLTILKYLLSAAIARWQRTQKELSGPYTLDAHKTRKDGRILAKKDSIGAPGIDEIMRAAKELGLNPSCEDEKMYPRSWWGYKGRVLIN